MGRGPDEGGSCGKGGQRVVVVGAGIAGLTAAQHLRQDNYVVTVRPMACCLEI
jgi:monoamine oxidase